MHCLIVFEVSALIVSLCCKTWVDVLFAFSCIFARDSGSANAMYTSIRKYTLKTSCCCSALHVRGCLVSFASSSLHRTLVIYITVIVNITCTGIHFGMSYALLARWIVATVIPRTIPFLSIWWCWWCMMVMVVSIMVMMVMILMLVMVLMVAAGVWARPFAAVRDVLRWGRKSWTGTRRGGEKHMAQVSIYCSICITQPHHRYDRLTPKCSLRT